MLLFRLGKSWEKKVSVVNSTLAGASDGAYFMLDGMPTGFGSLPTTRYCFSDAKLLALIL